MLVSRKGSLKSARCPVLVGKSPLKELRTDNALMIAYAASHRIGQPSPIDADVLPNFDAKRLFS